MENETKEKISKILQNHEAKINELRQQTRKEVKKINQQFEIKILSDFAILIGVLLVIIFIFLYFCF